MEMLSDAAVHETEMIRQAQRGDERAFEEIYRKHRRRVYSVCARVTRNSAEAEDLTQETFLQLYRKLSSFRGESSLWTWLYRVTLNIVLMNARHKLPMASIEPVGDAADSEQVNIELAREDLLLSGSVNRIALLAAIDRLPPGYRIVLWLHDVLGYEHGEIAEIMGCTMGSSKSQLHKARLNMRAQLLGRPARNSARPIHETAVKSRRLRRLPANTGRRSVTGVAALPGT